MWSGQGVYEALCTRTRPTEQSDSLCDITDGLLYKEKVKQDRFTITFTFNTDGVPVFKSSGYTFWPLYLVINELPYRMRYRNIIVTYTKIILYNNIS